MESMALWAHGHNDTSTAGHIDTYTYTCTHIHLHTHTPTNTSHTSHCPISAFQLQNPKAPHYHQRWVDTPVNMLSLFPSPSLLALLAGQVTIGTTGGWWLYAFCLRNPKAPYCHQRWVDTPVNMLSLFPSPSLRLKLSVLSNAHSICGTQRPRIVVHDGSAGYVFAYVFKYNH